MPRLRSSGAALGLVLALAAGCHTAECYSGTITVAAAVAPDAEAPIVMLFYEDGWEGEEWYGLPGPPRAYPPERPLTFQPGTAEYGFSFCEPCPTCSAGGKRLGAFVDLNGNGALDYGELFGLYGGTPRDTSRNDFVIDQIHAP